MGTRPSRRRPGMAVALVSAALAAGCGDLILSKESKREIAAVRAAVEANGEAVNQPTPTGELPILVAVRMGSSSLAAWLIARGASPVARSARGRTPLHDLITYDGPSYAVMSAMLARGYFDVNVADDQGFTPLHIAAQVLKPEAIDFLVRRGADPNRTDSRGGTPLHELGALLLPPEPKRPPPDPRLVAAQQAAVAATMDRLLKAGERLDGADAQGMRPLHRYAWSGNVTAVDAALARGADVSAVDARGQTPLFVAAAFARADVVSLLLAAGADVRHLDARGFTALAAMRYTRPTPPDAPKVVAMLKAAGATEPAQLPDASRDTDATAATPPKPIDLDLRGELLAAQSGDVLLANTYIDDQPFRAFVETFRSAPAVALCADVRQLQALAPVVTATGPPHLEWREVVVGASCKALAFFRTVPGLSPGGSVEPSVAIEPAGGDSSAARWRFRFRDHLYALRVTDRWLPEPASPLQARRARLQLLRDGEPVATLFETGVGDELACNSPPWLGDLNGDRAIDVVLACHRNIYEQWSGVSLSVPGGTGRRLLLQRENGGSL